MTNSNRFSSELSLTHLPSDLLLTTSETAAYLGVTEGTISVWRCTGRYPIPYIKIGRLVKYRKSALDAFIAQRTIGAVLTEQNGSLS